jgi:hypothetical protein
LQNNQNSQGDIDVAILEEAARQYYVTVVGRDDISGGSHEFMTLLGGRSSFDEFNSRYENYQSESGEVSAELVKEWLLEQAAEEDGVAIWLGTDYNPETQSLFDGGGHALAIVDINVENNTISYVNPWDASTLITQNLDDFCQEQAEKAPTFEMMDRDGVWA